MRTVIARAVSATGCLDAPSKNPILFLFVIETHTHTCYGRYLHHCVYVVAQNFGLLFLIPIPISTVNIKK